MIPPTSVGSPARYLCRAPRIKPTFTLVRLKAGVSTFRKLMSALSPKHMMLHTIAQWLHRVLPQASFENRKPRILMVCATRDDVEASGLVAKTARLSSKPLCDPARNGNFSSSVLSERLLRWSRGLFGLVQNLAQLALVAIADQDTCFGFPQNRISRGDCGIRNGCAL